MLKSNLELKDAIMKFREDKEASNKKQDKYSYYKIEEYIELLDSCFGVDGYRVAYTEGQLCPFPTGQMAYMSKAVVTVLDVEDKPVLTFEGYGTYEINISSTDAKFIQISTVGMNGCVNALKSACANFGAFGSRNMTDEEPKGSASSSADAASKPRSNPLPLEEVTFYVTKAAVEQSKDQSTGEPMYKLTCNEVVGTSARQVPSEVLFYPNQYRNKGAEKLGRVTSVKKPFKLTLKVSRVNKEKEGVFATYTFKEWAS